VGLIFEFMYDRIHTRSKDYVNEWQVRRKTINQESLITSPFNYYIYLRFATDLRPVVARKRNNTVIQRLIKTLVLSKIFRANNNNYILSLINHHYITLLGLVIFISKLHIPSYQSIIQRNEWSY